MAIQAVEKRIPERIRKTGTAVQETQGSQVIEGVWKGRTLLNYDWILVAAVFLIIAFGLIMLYSASSYTSQLEYGTSFYFVRRQLISTAVGIVVMLGVSLIPIKIWNILSPFAYAVGIVLVCMVMSPLGVENNGARRWLGIGGFSLQPSEVLKFALILIMAFMLSRLQKKTDNPKVFFGIFLVGIISAGLVGTVTDDLGTAIIFFCMILVIMFLCCKKPLYLMISVLIVAAAAVFFLFSDSYRLERIEAWIHVEDYSDTISYQIMQALYAIGSGGIFGKGIGKSTQKLTFVPEAENDMIFSIICEELGLVGVIILVGLYAVIIWRMKIIFDRTADMFSRLVVAGVALHISIQSIVNMCVVSGLIPNTGVPLPFISYGGTSTIILMAEIGLVLSVCRKKT